MSDPVSTSFATYFSVAKLWSITAGVGGSVIPILALADKAKISLTNAICMAVTGSSFSIFVGPYLAQRLDISSLEGIVALSWIMGATGVFLIRAVLKWLDSRGVQAIDTIVNKVTGTTSSNEPQTSNVETENNNTSTLENERNGNGTAK